MIISSLTALVTVVAVYTCVQGQDKGLRRDKGIRPVGWRSGDDVNFQSSNDTTEDDQENDGLRTPDAVDLIDRLFMDYGPNGFDMPRDAPDGEFVPDYFLGFTPPGDSWTTLDLVPVRPSCEVTVMEDEQGDQDVPSTSNGVRPCSDCNQRHAGECRRAIRSKTNTQTTQNGRKQEAVKRCRGKQSCAKRITEEKLRFYGKWLPKFIGELAKCRNPKHGAFMSEYLREHRRLMVQLEDQLRNDIIKRFGNIVTVISNLCTDGVKVDPDDPSLTEHLQQWCPAENAMPQCLYDADFDQLEMHNTWVKRAEQRIDKLTTIYANLNTVTAENFNTQSTARQPVATLTEIRQSIRELVEEIMRQRQIGAALIRLIRMEEKEMQALEKKMKRRSDDEDDGTPDHKKKKRR